MRSVRRLRAPSAPSCDRALLTTSFYRSGGRGQIGLRIKGKWPRAGDKPSLVGAYGRRMVATRAMAENKYPSMAFASKAPVDLKLSLWQS
jgi:hypothetical protein